MADDRGSGAIEKFRAEIDEIDSELLRLLNRRALCAQSIGKIKKENNQPIHVPERERVVLERLIARNQGPLTAEAVEEVFQIITHQMKTLQGDTSGES